MTNQEPGHWQPATTYNGTCGFVLCDVDLIAKAFITMKCE